MAIKIAPEIAGGQLPLGQRRGGGEVAIFIDGDARIVGAMQRHCGLARSR
jgi:hypothetical protein